MTGIGNYIQRIICVSLICSVLSGLTKESFINKQMQLLTALFLSLTILMPIYLYDYPEPEKMLETYRTEAESAVDTGTVYLRKSQQDIIIQETEAYILSKAKMLGAELNVKIMLTDADPPMLETATFSGVVSKNVQQVLADTVEKDLGIPKERQIWMTELENNR